MKTKLITLNIYKASAPEPVVSCEDMSSFGWVLLGTREVEISMPSSDVDTTEAEIIALNAKARKVKDDSTIEVAALNRQVKQLRNKQNGAKANV
tara:strand:+ start:718 stop:999 length:282 start_codon:yes stop_codon:yes gene_type:complete